MLAHAFHKRVSKFGLVRPQADRAPRVGLLGFRRGRLVAFLNGVAQFLNPRIIWIGVGAGSVACYFGAGRLIKLFAPARVAFLT
jgi:hypothetical protein